MEISTFFVNFPLNQIQNCSVQEHTWMGETGNNISLDYQLVLVSSSALVCYSRSHYPMLEKLDGQNIAAYENQGTQREFNDH